MGWKDFHNAEKEELLRIRTYPPFELEAKIAILMNVAGTYEVDLQTGALIDCFFNLYMFANENSLKDEDLTYLIKLQTELLGNCAAGFTIQQNLKYFTRFFKENVKKTGEEAIAEMESFSNVKTSSLVMDYIFLTFFQHYELYHQLFHSAQDVHELEREIYLDVVPPLTVYPHPLEEGISEEWYNLYLNPAPEVDEEEVTGSEDITPVEATPVPTEPTPAQEVPSENELESLLASIDPLELKKMIKEMAEKKLDVLKTDLEAKIIEKEAFLLKNLEKLKV